MSLTSIYGVKKIEDKIKGGEKKDSFKRMPEENQINIKQDLPEMSQPQKKIK